MRVFAAIEKEIVNFDTYSREIVNFENSLFL
jgi:hypothetical protein